MSCRVIISPITKQETPSQTWNDIRMSLEDNESYPSLRSKESRADEIYQQLATPEFIAKFGDWINEPETVKEKTNTIGEPFMSEIDDADIIQYARPTTYADQLAQFVERWNLQPVAKDGIKGYAMTLAGAKAMGKQQLKNNDLYNKLRIRYNTSSAILEIAPREIEEFMQMNRAEQELLVGREVFETVVGKMADRLGVKYQVVTAAEARELTKNAKNPYNGEYAFNLNGTAYILDTALSLTNGIHEVIHPFVDAVFAQNEGLFTKLYKDLIVTATGAKIAQEVRANYADFSEEEQMKEIIVRAITAAAVANVEQGEEQKVKSILARFWFAVKQYLKDLFGGSIDVKNISEDSTIEDLANMLTTAGVKINTNYVSEQDFIQFNRDNQELREQLIALGDDNLNKIINDNFSMMRSHVKKVMENPTYEDLKKITTNENQSNKFETVKDMLARVKDIGNEIEDTAKKAKQMASVISETEMITGKIVSRIMELQKDSENLENLMVLNYYKSILVDFDQFYKNINKELLKNNNGNNLLFNKVGLISHNVSSALAKITQNNEPTLVKILSGVLATTREEIDNEHFKKIARYNEAIAAGKNVAAAEKMKREEMEAYGRMNLSNENLLRSLQGKNGDTSAFSGFFEAYISSPDPIIGGFAAFIQTNMYQVQAKVRQTDVAMRAELKPYYNDVNRVKTATLGKQVTFLDDIMTWKDGKPVKGKVVSLLNQFKNYRADVDLLQHEIDVARHAGDKVLELQLKSDMEDLQANYMQRRYTDEYYKVQELWKSDIGRKAKDIRTEIFEDIRDIENAMTSDPDARKEDMEEIKNLLSKYSQLGALTDDLGNMKTGEELEIANVIREYNERSRPFYEWKVKPGLFESRRDEMKANLLDEGITEGSEEYKDRVQAWMNENLKVNLKTTFYDDRQVILDSITEILSVLPDGDRKELEISPLWEQIIELTKGFRDDDGQPMGQDLTPEKIAKVKEIQLAIIDAQGKYSGMIGLTKAESAELSSLFDNVTEYGYSVEDTARIKELMDRKNAVKNLISKGDKLELTKLFEKLKALQSKIPTDGYMNTMNTWMSKINQNPMSLTNIDQNMLQRNMDDVLDANPEFKDWFLANHIEKERWNSDVDEMETYYERLYVWSVIRPNDPKYYNTFTLSTGETILGTPKNEYFSRAVKDEFHTGYNRTTEKIELQVGVHVDNKGKFLPKTIAQGAKYSKYINEGYEKLRREKPNEFKILEIFTKYHLAGQEGGENGNKLYLDVPRFRKQAWEYLQEGTLTEDAKSKIKEIGVGVRSLVRKEVDDFDRGDGNFNIEESLVSTDMFGNEMLRVPIKGVSRIPVEEVSMDIGSSIINHISSIETNKKLIEIQPIAKALMDTLEENGVQNINKINRKIFQTTGLKTFIPDAKNIRLQIIKNFYDREFLGIEHHMELGQWGNKMANQLMRLASLGSLAANPTSAVKNLFAASVQGYIESLGGKHINPQELNRGFGLMNRKYIPAMIADYNKFDDHSAETQLMRMFDFIQGGTDEKLGNEYTDANVRNGISGSFLFFGQKIGEIEAQGAFGLGLMMHQTVKQTINGVTKEIQYLDAFEKKNGVMVLKEGIDPEWTEGGKKFNEFKLLAHELSQKLQGNYAKFTQPEMQRYTTGRLANFMRRYFVPALTNRFSPDRIQVGVHGRREGYYIGFLKVVRNAILTRQTNWHLYSDDEKKAFIKTLSEVTLSLMFYLLLRSLGWNPNDEDRVKKLKDNSWATNHLIYLLMGLKSESEQFIPVPGIGGDEIMRLLQTPSIAFNHLKKWYTLLTAVIHPFEELKQDSGVWHKGDNKLLVQMAKVAGYNGTTANPEVAIKNFVMMQAR